MTTLETRGRRHQPEQSLRGTQNRVGGAVHNKTLANLVLDAVRRVQESDLNPPVSCAAPAACRPHSMLAMLTYCYAIGVYGSKDVEEMMYLDTDFRAMCGMEYPNWKQMKKFRRENPQVLRWTIQETFRGLWKLQTEHGRNSTPANLLPFTSEDRCCTPATGEPIGSPAKPRPASSAPCSSIAWRWNEKVPAPFPLVPIGRENTCGKAPTPPSSPLSRDEPQAPTAKHQFVPMIGKHNPIHRRLLPGGRAPFPPESFIRHASA